MLKNIAYYYIAGAGLGFLAQMGVVLPGIQPLAAPNLLLNLTLWPAELLAGLLGQPIVLNPQGTGLPQPVTFPTNNPFPSTYVPGVAAPSAASTPWGY